MTDYQITDLSTGTVKNDNIFVIVDPDDTTTPPAGAGGSDKQITWGDLTAGLLPLSGGTMTGPIAMGGSKITGLADGSVSGDAVAFDQLSGYAPLASPALTGSPTAPTASPGTDSTRIATTAYTDAAVAVETARAEAAEALLLPLAGGTMTGAIAMGTHKITGLTNGSSASDAAAFGQIPASLPPTGSASGDLSGTYPGPAVVQVNGAAVPVSKTIIGTNGSGQIVDASSASLTNNTSGNAATATNLAGGATLPAYIAPHVTTLTDGTAVAVSAAAGNDFRWTIGANGNKLSNPTSPVNGQIITIAIKYSGTFTPAFDTAYDFGSAGAPAWTATSGKTDYTGFRYDSALAGGSGAWAYQGSVLGLTS